MAEDNKGTPTSVDPDPIKDKNTDPITQLKGEFNRKLGDTNKLIEQMAETNKALTAKLEALVNPKTPPKKEESLDALMYSDPKRYTQLIEERATSKAVEIVRAETQGQGMIQARIAELVAEYPELSDNNSDLTKQTVELLKGVNAMQKADPTTYEYAVLKAAQHLDVKPKSKRPKQEDDFIAPTYSSPKARQGRQTEDRVIKENKDFAKQVGVNLDDDKKKAVYLEKLREKGVL